MEYILNLLTDFIGAAVTVVVVIAAFLIVQRLFNKQQKGKSDSIVKQIVLSIIILIGGILIVMALPIKNELRGQIISLIGIVLSAAIALSATTFLGNAFAGLMNKIINHFAIGDYIQVKDYFGRVSDMGLLHTELQVENRDLVTLPNLYLATNPVKVIRNSGTVISTTVSLGYDVPRVKIENALLAAAKEAGLTDPFVYVTSLGDFSVVYKIHGMLADTNLCITANSKLNKMVMDALHNAKIEIVSPTFMNQRQIKDTVFIPAKIRQKEAEQEASPESIIFDKAVKAETLVKKNERLQELEDRIEEMKVEMKQAESDEEKQKLSERIEKWTATLKKTKEKIAEETTELKNEDKGS